MPDTDVSKMKVADLKRELKLRGLATTGNKTELQDRLQTALIDGELSLEDTAISGEDLLDEDDPVLTDEDEAKILGADENELLKSPTATPTTAPDLTDVGKHNTSSSADAILENMETLTPATTTRKIVLKRKSSFTAVGVAGAGVAEATGTIKENNEPIIAKVPKMSERNPITVTTSQTTTEKDKGIAKVMQLTNQERLEMRAKKFGITAANNNGGISTGITNAGSNTQQIETLKKRAERFGCVVSSKIAKIDAEEKLQKRKERFGGGAGESKNGGSASNDIWAEKARQRLERFKTAPTTSTQSSVALTTTVVSTEATAAADN